MMAAGAGGAAWKWRVGGGCSDEGWRRPGWLDGRGWASGTEYQRRAEGVARAERGEIRKGEI